EACPFDREPFGEIAACAEHRERTEADRGDDQHDRATTRSESGDAPGGRERILHGIEIVSVKRSYRSAPAPNRASTGLLGRAVIASANRATPSRYSTIDCPRDRRRFIAPSPRDAAPRSRRSAAGAT